MNIDKSLSQGLVTEIAISYAAFVLALSEKNPLAIKVWARVLHDIQQERGFYVHPQHLLAGHAGIGQEGTQHESSQPDKAV